MFLSAWCHLPAPVVQLRICPGPRPANLMQVIAFRRGAGFVRPCLVTSLQGEHKAVTQRAIFWLLLIIKLIENGVWSLGMTEGGLLDWQRPCVRNGYLSVCNCVGVRVCASGSVCGIILENLSL